MQESSGAGAPPREAPEKVEKARVFCEALLAKLGIAAAVEARETAEAIFVSCEPPAAAPRSCPRR